MNKEYDLIIEPGGEYAGLVPGVVAPYLNGR